MKFFKRLFKMHRDKNGWLKVKLPEIEHLHSRIYFDYKSISDLNEFASSENFKKELAEASHGLSSVIMYRNMYQLELNERGEQDQVLIAKMFLVCRFSNSIYSALRLACMGMILDSISCLKTAFEALQYVRLISLDTRFASNFMVFKKRSLTTAIRLAASLSHSVTVSGMKMSKSIIP